MAFAFNLKNVLVFLVSLIFFSEYLYVKSDEFKRCHQQSNTNFYPLLKNLFNILILIFSILHKKFIF